MLEFLTGAEADALINAPPDRTRWTGRRDHALLVLAIQTGLRVSELCSLTTSNAHFGSAASITCTGKGRRKRANAADRDHRRGHERLSHRASDPPRSGSLLRTRR